MNTLIILILLILEGVEMPLYIPIIGIIVEIAYNIIKIIMRKKQEELENRRIKLMVLEKELDLPYKNIGIEEMIRNTKIKLEGTFVSFEKILKDSINEFKKIEKEEENDKNL